MLLLGGKYEDQTLLTSMVGNQHRRTDTYYSRFIHHLSLHNHNSFVGYCDFILVNKKEEINYVNICKLQEST